MMSFFRKMYISQTIFNHPACPCEKKWVKKQVQLVASNINLNNNNKSIYIHLQYRYIHLKYIISVSTITVIIFVQFIFLFPKVQEYYL